MSSPFGTSLFPRQNNPFEDAKDTLSSWDKCMAKDYCKWPVIVAIIIGVLVLISVFMCILQCCGCACACLKCFTDCFRCFCCCSCCRDSSSSSNKHERLDSNSGSAYPYPTPYGAPAPNQYANPYQAQAVDSRPSMDTRPVNQQYRSNAMPTMNSSTQQPERPQFATFDSTRAVVNEDALPPMPMYKEGRDIHVEVEEEPVPQKQGDMELERLDRNGSVTSGTATGMGAVAAGARRSPEGRSPIYGAQQNDSFVSSATPLNNSSPYGRPYAQQDDYRRGSPAQNLSPVYGAGGGYGQQQPYGRGQPQPYGGEDSYGQQQPYGRSSPQAYGSQDQLTQYNNQPAAYGQRNYYDEPDNRYQSPPPNSNPYGYDTNPPYPSYDNFGAAPAPAPQRSHTPGYASSESTAFEPPAVSAYPGQRSYTPVSTYPGQQQQPYRAFTPQAQQQQQQPYTHVQRKPLDGTYSDV